MIVRFVNQFMSWRLFVECLTWRILRIVYVQRKVWKLLTMLILGNGTRERVHKFMFL